MSGYKGPERRRSGSQDKLEEVLITVVRMDERQKSMDQSLLNHFADFKLHVEKDDKRFTAINWFIGIGVGITSTLEFIFKK